MIDFKNYLAFRLKEGKLYPVKHPHIPPIDLLLNVERQKEVLLRNTLQFVKGYPANDVLLWGDRGTGKSSLVKSLLGVFGENGLRIIQVYKMDIIHLSDLYETVRDQPYWFILFFDDLSFEPGEESFKTLKSFMEGDIEERPRNILVYATSNRRNLVPQLERDEKFPEESQLEVISLVERFGIKLGFFAFGKEEYLKIVKTYAKERKLDVEEPFLEKLALEWATYRGSFSGRTAFQFIKDLEGRLRCGTSLSFYSS
ncbi:ATP-binding protein [Thermocrinis minervae]|nr:ATP-binding protein [Thermocrinis minervae]